MNKKKFCEKCRRKEGVDYADVGTHDAFLCLRCYRTLDEEIHHPLLGRGYVSAPYCWFWKPFYRIKDFFSK